jgi:hypothetical protein
LIRKAPDTWISACHNHHCKKLYNDQITTFLVFTPPKKDNKNNNGLKRAIRSKTSEFKIRRSEENKSSYNKRKQFLPSTI